MIVSLLYAHSCKVGHCRRLVALGHARSDAAARINVCCIAGRPTFVHDFIMFFVVNRKQTASYIWDHGDIPKRWEHGDPLPDCGAKQLMLSRLSTHYRAWFNQETLDADTKAAFLELLASLAAGYYFCNAPVHVSLSKTVPQPRLFDFTEGGLAYLELVRTFTGAYIVKEPLALELAAYLGVELDTRPKALATWEQLGQLQRRGASATVRADRPLIVHGECSYES